MDGNQNKKMNVYVYRTHFWNDFIKSQHDKLQQDLGIENVFLLFDDTVSRAPHHLDFARLDQPIPLCQNIAINFRECQSINPLHRSNKDNIESQIIIFKWLCGRHFDFLWIIEYDVYCDGDWNLALQPVHHDIETGYLAAGVYDHNVHIIWNHWFSLYGRKWNKPPLNERVKSFFPLVRISKELIACIEKNIGIYSGFCEIYIPTLARQNKIKYGSLPISMLGNPFDYITEKNIKIEKKNNHKIYHPIVQAIS
jgi:hypothetical protein